VVSNAFDICTAEANLIQTHGTLQAQLKRAQKNKGSHAASYLTSEFGRVQLLHRSRIPIPEDTCLKYDDAPNMQSAYPICHRPDGATWLAVETKGRAGTAHTRCTQRYLLWWYSTVVEVHADVHHCHVERRMQCSVELGCHACLLALWRRQGDGTICMYLHRQRCSEHRRG
jgi:hypothetical protein